MHRNYTVEETARVFGVHKNTVRQWLKSGLSPIDDRRPTLIHGLSLRTFLEKRRANGRQPCLPGQIYCVKCRGPRQPAFDTVDYIPRTAVLGSLRGLCPVCTTLMHRSVSLVRLEASRGNLEVVFPMDRIRIEGRTPAIPNSDSEGDTKSHEIVQP